MKPFSVWFLLHVGDVERQALRVAGDEVVGFDLGDNGGMTMIIGHKAMAFMFLPRWNHLK